LLYVKEEQIAEKIINMSLNAILFIIGCVIFVLYLVGYVMVITSQNKIQDKEQGKSSNNK
jgi:uncharacterized membrane protein